MDVRILADEDIHRLFSMQAVIGIMEESFRQQAAGSLIHPPRISVDGSKGSLVFTVGESPAQGRGFGFRVYSRFEDTAGKNKQVVAVFDSDSGALKGLVIGSAVGDLRTGAINGVAIQHLARRDASVLGMIGTGRQALTQLQAAVAVRDFDSILVYSRSAEKRQAFARRMSQQLGVDIQPLDSARQVVEPADVLLCCTNSRAPVFDPAWVRRGAHIHTIGPKQKGGHELPLEVALESDLIAADTLAQIESMGANHFLHGHMPLERFVPLSEIVAGTHPGRTAPEQLTLFCSNGLAGTEVALAAEALEAYAAGS